MKEWQEIAWYLMDYRGHMNAVESRIEGALKIDSDQVAANFIREARGHLRKADDCLRSVGAALAKENLS